MKKTISMLLIVILTLTLGGCSTEQDSTNYIEKAKLTEEEEKIANLITDISNTEIFDFKIDGKVKTIEINLSELIDGSWELISGDRGQFKDKSGRVALSFGSDGEGYRVATQSKNISGYSSSNNEYIKELNRADIMKSSNVLDKKEEIIYEKEFPLVIQVLSKKDSLSALGLDSYFTPEVYKDDEYEHIYAISIMFSEKTIDELGEDVDK